MNSKRFFLIGILAMKFSFHVWAQDNNSSLASGQMSQEGLKNIPVNLSTGVSSVSIPIATMSFGGFDLPFSIDYNSGGGIRVEDDASWIGLGWTLSVGGSINRNMLGIPDEIASFPEIILIDGYPPIPSYNGGYFNTIVPPNYDLESIEQATDRILTNVLDVQPDEFYFNTPTCSGMFVFDKTVVSSNNNIITPVLIPHQDIKIERNVGTSAFVVTDINGYKYYFGNNCTQGITQTLVSNGVNIPQNYAGSYNTTWYLEKIVDCNDKILFTFEYEQNSQTTIETNGSSQFYKNIGGQNNFGISNSTSTISQNTIRLKKVISGNGEYALFSVAPSRLDITTEKALDNISFYDINNVLSRQVKFSYDYFVNTNNKKRLKLLNIKEKDALGNSILPTAFEYDDRMSNTINDQDHYGFYNGAGNLQLIPNNVHTALMNLTSNREPNSSFTQAGILKKITYPTGANTQFYYENNDYGKSNNVLTTALSVVTGGLRIKKIITDDGDLDHTNDMVQYYTYKMNTLNAYDINRSSGYLLTHPRYDLYQFACEGYGDVSWDIYSTLSNSLSQAVDNKSGIVAYEYVTEFNCDLDLYPNCGNEMGKTITKLKYEPNSGSSDYNTAQYPNASSEYSWRRSLPLEITTYDGLGGMISKTTNDYQFVNQKTVYGNKVIIKHTWADWADSNQDQNDDNHSYNYCWSPDYTYTYNSEWIKQIGSTKLSNENGSLVTTTKQITYATSHKNPIQIITTFPDGSATKQKIVYVDDYTTTGTLTAGTDKFILQKIKDKHLTTAQVHNTFEYKKPGVTSIYNYTGANFNKYGVFTINSIDYYLPAESYSIDINAPFSSTLATPTFNGSGNFIFDAKYKLKSKIISYSNLFNVILPQKVQDENGLKKSILYNTKLEIPIAQTSFQDNDFSVYKSYEQGNISFQESTPNTIVATPSLTTPYQTVTGERYLRINTAQNLSYQMPPGEYILSFWTDATPILADDNIDVISTRNDPIEPTGWQYNEYVIKANGSGIGSGNYNNIYISKDNMAIDELRIYPKNATMSTTCYNSIGQIISSCDINNNAMHNQYNSFNRLKLTFDRNRNIIKKYNYSQGDF